MPVERQYLYIVEEDKDLARGPEEATSCGEAGWEGENIEDVP